MDKAALARADERIEQQRPAQVALANYEFLSQVHQQDPETAQAMLNVLENEGVEAFYRRADQWGRYHQVADYLATQEAIENLPPDLRNQAYARIDEGGEDPAAVLNDLYGAADTAYDRRFLAATGRLPTGDPELDSQIWRDAQTGGAAGDYLRSGLVYNQGQNVGSLDDFGPERGPSPLRADPSSISDFAEPLRAPIVSGPRRRRRPAHGRSQGSAI